MCDLCKLSLCFVPPYLVTPGKGVRIPPLVNRYGSPIKGSGALLVMLYKICGLWSVYGPWDLLSWQSHFSTTRELAKAGKKSVREH